MKINIKRHLMPLASEISAGKFDMALARLERLSKRGLSTGWRTSLNRLKAHLRDPGRQAGHSIIVPGNSKLGARFLAFSTLPAVAPGDVACPGAGDCINWCYSPRAWRYPAAFVRQAINTILLQSSGGRAQILAHLDKMARGREIVFRNYVDGDLSGRPPVNGQDDAQFWFAAIAARPHLATYGYTKSYAQVRAAGPVPANYLFNVSSGSNHTPALIAWARRQQSMRGEFIAVDYAPVHSAADHGRPEHRALLVKAHKLATGRKAFACPGKCYECMPAGVHACGSEKVRDVDIIIAIH